MTAVTFFRDGASLLGFRADGHSGYAEEGGDIVCAAISALTQTAEIGLRKVAKAGVRTILDEEAALLEVRLLEREGPAWPAAQVILRTLEEGILDIEQQYPAFVRITYRERRQTT
ncbi:MAG: ribosomal-processing cysteine protease Prp [Eubacteriales bacterium]|nr:ribosomal-processing cysteine protease Prp [Eubacteriales bacterium]